MESRKMVLMILRTGHLFVTPWTAAPQASLSITNSRSLPKLMSIELVMPSNHLNPLLSPSPPALNLSQHRVFSNESALHIRWPKLWGFKLQRQSFQWKPRDDLLYNGLVGFPCIPRDSQESSPTPQFKSINSLVLSFLYSPTLTSIHSSDLREPAWGCQMKHVTPSWTWIFDKHVSV